MEQVIEPHEWLRITTGICGDAQEGDFMNATLQQTGGRGEPGEDILEFSVACHIGVPGGIDTEEKLAEHLQSVLQAAIDGVRSIGQDIAFEVQLGPYGDGEE